MLGCVAQGLWLSRDFAKATLDCAVVSLPGSGGFRLGGAYGGH